MNKYFKTTSAMLFLLFTSISFAQIIPNHKSTVDPDEYHFVIFVKDYEDDYVNLTIYSQAWVSGGGFYKIFDGFIDSTYTLEADEVKYESVYNASTGRCKSLLEVRDSTNSYPIGFLYSGEASTGDTTLSATDRDKFIELQDTMNVHTGYNDTMPLTLGMQSFSQVSYPISFDEADNYASGYTPGELAYVIEHNADGYKFELIQDTDRSNLLVGFRYKSGLDNNTYTKFIVPNN